MSTALGHDSARASSRSARRSTLTGTGKLLRFMLRRNRIYTPMWVLGIALIGFYVAHAIQIIAETDQELANLTTMFTDPVGRMMTGPAFGMDAPTHERFFAAGYVLFIYILMALMSVFTVVRHTRAEEQSGRAELVRSNAVGRHATLTATLVLVSGANLIAAGFVWVAALTADYSPEGSALVAAGGLAVGLFFSGAAAVSAQLSESSRGASAMAGGLLGLAYLIRMSGDAAEVGGSALSWFSPLGWAQQTAPYVEDRWWPLALLVGFAVALMSLGFWLSTKRDLGAGLMHTRPGRPEASPALGTPAGIAARTLRGTLRGWAIALLITGLMYGGFAQTMLDTADDLPAEMAQIFAGDDIMLGYLAYMALFMAVFVAAAGVGGLQLIRGEEGSGHAEYLMSAPLSRTAWLGAHLAVLLTGLLLLVALVGAGMGIGTFASLEEDGGRHFGQIFLGSLAQTPAVLAVIGIVIGLFGWAPRLAIPAGWVVIGFAGFMTTFGGLLELPRFVESLNVFGHLAEYPVEEIAWTPVLWLTGLGAVGIAVGFLGWNRREISRA